MKHLKILVWNDNETYAKKWQTCVANGDAPEDLERVPVSTSKNVAEVIHAFETEMPDVVVLDIKCDGDPKMGLRIAAGIREKDFLVPIIAVTRDPEVVYLATNEAEVLGFAGVFEESVMKKNVFEPIALRPSLNQWHLVAPEFALVRACIKAIQSAFGNEEQNFVNELCPMLAALPFSGSVESWHTQVREPLLRLMRRRSLTKMAERFDFMAQLFERSDPFYMAGSRSRRHLSHNVQVFLLGLAVLTGLDVMSKTAVNHVQKLRSSTTAKEALMDAILIWACIANTHDTAYLSEHLGDLTGRLNELVKDFATVIPPTTKIKGLPKVVWPSYPHAEIAAKFWRQNLPADPTKWSFDEQLCDVVASGIARHDSKHFKNQPVSFDRWQEFLAVLSDELQDWGRERLTNPPGARPYETVTWNLFCLEGVEIKTVKNVTGEEARIELTFIARDHPQIIAKRFGSDGEETVRSTIARIAQSLRDNLRSISPFGIDLTVRFVSRPKAGPVFEPVSLQPPT